MESHPSRLDVWRLLAGESLDRPVKRQVLRHLARRCPECSRHVRCVLEDPVPADETAQHAFGYDAALDRAWERARMVRGKLARERRHLPRALAALERGTRGLGGLARHENVAVQGLARVELLLAASFRERYRDPQEMVRLAEAARRTAENDLPAELGEALRADVQARVWTELGNAYRVAERLGDARAAFARAEELQQAGTGEPLLDARLRELKASYYRAQRWIADALLKLVEAGERYEELHEERACVRVLSKRGIILDHAGRPREAAACFREGLERVDSERDPDLATSLTLSLVYALLDCGEAREAGALLLKSDLRRAFAGEPLKLLKLRWLEGRVLAGRGNAKAAERVFREVRTAFAAQNQHYDAALVGLELAELWQPQGRFREIEDIAIEAQETFERLGVSAAASAALVLRRMAHYDFVDEESVTHLKRFVARHQNDRHLIFEWPPIFQRSLGLG